MSNTVPDDLRSERSNVSVLKVDLARLRERDKCGLVIVLEGKDDLPVYEAWLKRLDDGLTWEPLVAKGKGKSLAFRRLLKRDQTGLGICTYFVIDHDYDGLRGEVEGDELFVLPSYSIENYLAHESVLDSYLRAELRVIGLPATRRAIVDLYVQAREIFMRHVRASCEMLFGARNEPCGNVTVRDTKITLTLTDGSIDVVCRELDRLVETENPVSVAAISAGTHFFEHREASCWIRGKYLLDFMKAFCELVYKDRISDDPVLFEGKVADASLSAAGLDIRSLASRSPLPENLGVTLEHWKQQCGRDC